MSKLSREERSTRRLGYVIGVALVFNAIAVASLFVGVVVSVFK